MNGSRGAGLGPSLAQQPSNCTRAYLIAPIAGRVSNTCSSRETASASRRLQWNATDTQHAWTTFPVSGNMSSLSYTAASQILQQHPRHHNSILVTTAVSAWLQQHPSGSLGQPSPAAAAAAGERGRPPRSPQRRQGCGGRALGRRRKWRRVERRASERAYERAARGEADTVQ